jgi:hypothetical protein
LGSASSFGTDKDSGWSTLVYLDKVLANLVLLQATVSRNPGWCWYIIGGAEGRDGVRRFKVGEAERTDGSGFEGSVGQSGVYIVQGATANGSACTGSESGGKPASQTAHEAANKATSRATDVLFPGCGAEASGTYGCGTT